MSYSVEAGTLIYVCRNTECDDEGVSWPVAIEKTTTGRYFTDDESIFCRTCGEEGNEVD